MEKYQSLKNNLKNSGKSFFMHYTVILIGVMLIAGTISTNAQAKPDKNAAALKSAQAGLDKANAQQAKIERQMAIADSLVETGTTMVNEAKSEIKQLASDKKNLDKEYASAKKPLDKRINSTKDKADATAARGELKELDVKYRADTKENTTKTTAANKKLATGNANINKGKASKKSGETALKTAKTNVKIAEDKLNKLSQ